MGERKMRHVVWPPMSESAEEVMDEEYSTERIFGVLSILTAFISPLIGVTLAIISFKRNENPTNGIIGIMIALVNAVIGYFLWMDLVRQLGGI
jgi:drug/metabolite transporter (DMT)-like permease